MANVKVGVELFFRLYPKETIETRNLDGIEIKIRQWDACSTSAEYVTKPLQTYEEVEKVVLKIYEHFHKQTGRSPQEEYGCLFVVKPEIAGIGESPRDAIGIRACPILEEKFYFNPLHVNIGIEDVSWYQKYGGVYIPSEEGNKLYRKKSFIGLYKYELRKDKISLLDGKQNSLQILMPYEQQIRKRIKELYDNRYLNIGNLLIKYVSAYYKGKDLVQIDFEVYESESKEAQIPISSSIILHSSQYEKLLVEYVTQTYVIANALHNPMFLLISPQPYFPLNRREALFSGAFQRGRLSQSSGVFERQCNLYPLEGRIEFRNMRMSPKNDIDLIITMKYLAENPKLTQKLFSILTEGVRCRQISYSYYSSQMMLSTSYLYIPITLSTFRCTLERMKDKIERVQEAIPLDISKPPFLKQIEQYNLRLPRLDEFENYVVEELTLPEICRNSECYFPYEKGELSIEVVKIIKSYPNLIPHAVIFNNLKI